jgi:DNA mismatch endonuclease Vsr
MPDIMSKEERSVRMGRVRCSNTAFEQCFLRVLSAEVYPLGYRYRKHYRRAFGTPDVAFVKQRIAVFLDSDFWHGRSYDPRTSRMSPFWKQKIERNIARDREVNRELRRSGWRVLRFGQTTLTKKPEAAARRVLSALASADM